MRSHRLNATQRQRLELLRMVCDVWNASVVNANLLQQSIAFGCAAGAINLAWECNFYDGKHLVFLRELIGDLYTERLVLADHVAESDIEQARRTT